MEGTLSEIRWFAGNFAPRGWFFCQGQLLSIAEYTALFALVGTTFGGDGQVTFALPDFRSRIPVGTGQGPGLSLHNLGEMAGSENQTMSVSNMPAHVHGMTASSEAPTSGAASGNYLASGGTQPNIYGVSAGVGDVVNMGSAVAATGGNAPFGILQPTITINYIICSEGIFPSRN